MVRLRAEAWLLKSLVIVREEKRKVKKNSIYVLVGRIRGGGEGGLNIFSPISKRNL